MPYAIAIQQFLLGGLLDWVKNWRIPVEQATYRLVAPTALRFADWQATPDHAALVDWHGQNAIEVTQAPLQKLPFTVVFRLR